MVVVFALGLVWFLLGEMVSNKGFGHIIGQNLSKLENRINEKKIKKYIYIYISHSTYLCINYLQQKPDTLHFDQLMARRSLNLPFHPHLLSTLTYKFPSRKGGGGGGGGG